MNFEFELDFKVDEMIVTLFFWCKTCGTGISINEIPGDALIWLGGPNPAIEKIQAALIQNSTHTCPLVP